MPEVFVDVSRKITLGYKDSEGIARQWPLNEKQINRLPEEVWNAAGKVRQSGGKAVLDALQESGHLQRLAPSDAERLSSGAIPFLAERRIIPPAQVGAATLGAKMNAGAPETAASSAAAMAAATAVGAAKDPERAAVLEAARRAAATQGR